MTATFEKLDLEGFRRRLSGFHFRRRIDAVHLHHTERPDHAAFAGEETIVAMWRHHTEHNGWSDIAQHITIDPAGGIWVCRDWNRQPASALGQNGTAARGPFMIEVVGNFDAGHDALVGEQRRVTTAAIAAVQDRFGLQPTTLRFHNEFSSKTCPGGTVDRVALIAEVSDERRIGRRGRGAVSVVGGASYGCGEETPAPLREGLPLEDVPVVREAAIGREERIGMHGRAAAPGPRRLAVCVGIDDYAEDPLQGAVSDAQEWTRLLDARGFEVRTLVNEQATWSEVLGAVRAMVATATAGSRLVFQFSGHGILLPDHDGDERINGVPDPTPLDDEALVPFDADTGAYILDDDLARIFLDLPSSVTATYFIDACFSGGIRHMGGVRDADGESGRTRFLRASERRIGAHLSFREALRRADAKDGDGVHDGAGALARSSAMELPPTITFSACQSDERALEIGGQGVFSRAALDVLERSPGITNADLHGDVVDAVRARARQTPVLDCADEARTLAALPEADDEARGAA